MARKITEADRHHDLVDLERAWEILDNPVDNGGEGELRQWAIETVERERLRMTEAA